MRIDPKHKDTVSPPNRRDKEHPGIPLDRILDFVSVSKYDVIKSLQHHLGKASFSEAEEALSAVITGDKEITPYFARCLEKAGLFDEYFWIDLQEIYDQAKNKKALECVGFCASMSCALVCCD